MDEYGDEAEAFTYDGESDDSDVKNELEIALYSQIYFQANDQAESK